MTDLAEFLRARIDEDEQAARAATAGPWSYDPGKVWLDGEAFETYDQTKGEEFVGYGGPSPFRGCVAATGPSGHPQSMADAAYVARWDPARVLAECEAKRQIIEHHAREPDVDGDPLGDTCTICSSSGPDTQGWPCATVRLLALPYQDHPDYREDWRPDTPGDHPA